MIVDLHTHVWAAPQQMGPTISRQIHRSDRQPWERLDTGTAAHERAMAPVRFAVVHGLQSRYGGASVTHQHVAAIVAQRPGSLVGFGGIDPLAASLTANIDEATSLGLVGITISPSGQAMHPCHSRAMRLYEECERRQLPVFVHGGDLFGHKAVLSFARPDHLDEVARSFPNLRLVIAQVGRPWIALTLELIGRHANVYAEVSGLVIHPWQLYNAVLLAHQESVHDKLLFGSGFPFCTPQEAILNVYSVNRFTHGTHLPGIPRQVLRSIVERDALSCLGINAPSLDVESPPAARVKEGAS